ncbi:hypothetical protein OEZ85_003083 [Tetradesmus obliquus]|uniref:Ig-like domain-containing protein n=1 Tax=Tetradesmus obliquus TaxID=3088 RepID=A0ABY8U3N4_TETOB|nr:hypothetical protein OEZ85_003083 [Tetradesmus obliquus]
MKRAATFAFLALLFCAASASWDSLDSMNLPAELEPVNEDIIPRLLQEVLGDAAVPGAYGAVAPAAATVEKVTPAAATPVEAPVTTTTPAAEPNTPAETPAAAPAAATPTPAETPAATTTTPADTPVTTVVQPTQQTVVEAPNPEPAVATPAETTPAPAITETTTTTTETTTTTTDAAAPAAAPASVAVIPAEASVCPAGSKRADYSSGTMFCVLAAQGDAKGELHISNGAGKAIPSGNSCFAAPCAAPSSSSMGRKMLRWLHATESAQAAQRAEFLPFLLAIARAVQPVQMDTASTLAHSKCFYVCEAEASSMGH